MLGTQRIPASEIKNYCEFPPGWGYLLDQGNPYRGVYRRVNHKGEYEYDVPNELVNLLTPNTEN